MCNKYESNEEWIYGNINDNSIDIVYPERVSTIYDFTFYGCVTFALLPGWHIPKLPMATF